MATMQLIDSPVTDQADDVTDTVAMARIVRRNQGSFESEVCCGAEVDLHKHLDSCKKHPGHHPFIPIHKFAEDNLPPAYRDDDLVECIRTLAELTVRITCNFISPDRPDTYPDNEKQYPFSSYRGNMKMSRYGTGWILHVNKDPLSSSKFCTCQECSLSPTPRPGFAEIEIRTAAHHIYDRLEMEHTTCDLFFDIGGVPDTNSIKLTSGRIAHVEQDYEGDMCDMSYITHDLALADRLEKTVSRYENLHRNVKDKYPTNEKDGEDCQVTATNTLTVIVSHPHGCSKQVTVGDYVNVNIMQCRNRLTQYIYNTSTCPGSSGAPVFILGRSWLWLFCEHPHSGNCEDRKELNYSGFALG